MTGAKMSADDLLDLPANRRPSELLDPLFANTVQAGPNPRPDHLPFQFTEYARHLHHGLAERAGAVDRLLIAVQGDAGSIHFRHRAGDVEDAPAKPVDGPDHEHAESAPHRILEHLVERGRWSRALAPLIPASW